MFNALTAFSFINSYLSAYEIFIRHVETCFAISSLLSTLMRTNPFPGLPFSFLSICVFNATFI